ncbi:hypothetical protein JXQ31_20255 [candidate division KSB1 bacterium]|nr:hypothetical protein [candidate division KSB1 bacterium]
MCLLRFFFMGFTNSDEFSYTTIPLIGIYFVALDCLRAVIFKYGKNIMWVMTLVLTTSICFFEFTHYMSDGIYSRCYNVYPINATKDIP